MLLGSFVAGFQHGLLIIAAPESVDTHDTWDPSVESVHAGPDSLYCGVRPAAGGLVSVTCIEDDEITGGGLVRIFSGVLSLPSRQLEFYDPNQTIRLVVPVEAWRSGVEIHADDAEEPETLVVRLTRPATA